MKRLRLFLLAFVFPFVFYTKAYGFSVIPMFLDMSPNGNNSRATLTVANSSPHPMPVQASADELTMDMNGGVATRSAKSDFVIFPPQAIISPHGKQTFRIQWRGSPALNIGKTYQINVAQVMASDNRPEKGNEGVSLGVQIGVAFGTIVSMSAAMGEPKPIVRSSNFSVSKSNKLVVEPVISNSSNQNFLLVQADTSVTLYGSNNKKLWGYVYSPDEMMRYFGLGIVQPGKSRRMKMPLHNLPQGIVRQVKSVKVEIRPSAK